MSLNIKKRDYIFVSYGILIVLILNAVYIGSITYINYKTSKSLEPLTITMINRDLLENGLPQLSSNDKNNIVSKLTSIGDDILILKVKIRTEQIPARDYLFMVKDWSSYFHREYHMILLDLQTDPDIKYKFTENYYNRP